MAGGRYSEVVVSSGSTVHAKHFWGTSYDEEKLLHDSITEYVNPFI